MRTLHCILTCLCALCSSLLPAADGGGGVAFRHFSVAEGLSQSTVRAIEGDELGNIWLGTQNGLNMYDGYGFRTYYRSATDSTSLSDNAIYSLELSSSSGNLWIGTSKGLSCRDFREGRFYNYSLPMGDQHVADIFESFGTLYLSTDSGVVVFNEEGHSFWSIDELKDLRDVRGVRMSDSGGLLIATKEGLYAYNRGDNASLVQVEAFRGLDISCIEPISSGYWIGTHGGGLYRTDRQFNIIRHFSSRGVDRIPSDYIRTMSLDEYGRLWVGTYDGLAVYDDLQGTFSEYVHSDSSETSLSHNSVWSIYMDSQRGVWVGTYYGGVNWWNRQNDKFHVVSLREPGRSQTYGYINCLTAGATHIWAGTNDDGLFSLDPVDGQHIERYYSGNVSTSGGVMSNNIKCVLEEPSGELYVGTHLGGLLRLNPRTRQAVVYNLYGSAPVYNGCYSMLERGDGSILIGATLGLYLFDKVSGTFSPYGPSELSSHLVNRLLLQSDGSLLVGTDTGLYSLSQDAEVVEEYPQVSGAYVNDMMQDRSGTVWIGTNIGLWGLKDGALTSYTMAEGLPNDYVYGILEDESSTLWISTGGGLCSLDRGRKTFKSHGYYGDHEFTPGACCATSDGAFVFGGLKGLTCFRPLDIFDSPWTPRPYVYDVTSRYAQLTGRGRVSVERRRSGAVRSSEIAVKDNTFTVRFTVPNPSSEGHNTYSYYLEGVDDSWYETSARDVVYSNIRPGRYEFHLKAANSDGLWSKEGETVSIRVVPRWYESTLAMVLWLLLIIGAIAYALRWYLTRRSLRQVVQSPIETPEEVQEGSPIEEDEFLARARSVVLDNLSNVDFSSDDFAAALYMSRSNLYLKLKEAGDESATQFIRRIRIEEACKLLREQRLTVAEISEQVGFGSPSYFATIFKKELGCLPSEYVKKK